MRTGERIAERRNAAGLSQTQLAKAAGVSQATIGKLESGISSGSSHLHRIARALRTSPAYLSGETNDPDTDIAPDSLTPEQREWVELMEAIQPKDRAAALHILRTLASRHHRPDPEQPAP